MDTASIAPGSSSVRDRVAEFRDERDLSNYNEAVKALLMEVDADQ